MKYRLLLLSIFSLPLFSCSAPQVSQPVKKTAFISEYCPEKNPGKSITTELLVHIACMGASKEPYPYFQLLSLMKVASAYNALNKHDYARFLFNRIEPRINHFSTHGQRSNLYQQLAILSVELGELEKALSYLKEVKSRRKDEWRSNIHAAIAHYHWRNNNLHGFNAALRQVRHPLSYATAISKTVLLHFRDDYSKAKYTKLIHSAAAKIPKIQLVQHQVRLYATLALACHKISNSQCKGHYFKKAKQVASNIKPKNISLVSRQGQSYIFISRAYAFINELALAEEFSRKINYKEWRIHTLPDIAYLYHQRGNIAKVDELIKTAWNKSKTLKDNIRRRKSSIQYKLITNMSAQHARMGNQDHAVAVANIIRSPKAHSRAFLALSRVYTGAWLPFSWHYSDFLSY